MTLRIPVIYGSVRSGRQGIKIARFVERQLSGRGHEVTLVDPLQEQLPLLERRFKDYQPGTAPAALVRLAELYRQADAFVIVSGEYNHSVPPALTNLLDHFLEEYFFRPSGIVSYSSGATPECEPRSSFERCCALSGCPVFRRRSPCPKSRPPPTTTAPLAIRRSSNDSVDSPRSWSGTPRRSRHSARKVFPASLDESVVRRLVRYR